MFFVCLCGHVQLQTRHETDIRATTFAAHPESTLDVRFATWHHTHCARAGCGERAVLCSWLIGVAPFAYPIPRCARPPPCPHLQHVVRMLVGLHVHRIVVTGYDGKPLSVVSITDVLAALVQEPAGYFGTFFDD